MELNLTGRTGHGTPDDFATLSVVMIDGDDLYVDNGAIHGKSRLERGVDFRTYTKPEDVPNGRKVKEVWVQLKSYETGRGYYGLVSAELVVNSEDMVGYKSMGALVMAMDGAIKGKFSLAHLTTEERAKFRNFLETFRADLWANTPEEIKGQL
ncbi:YwhD family protein [Tumebacillus permanentifrigoris]|uniref:YwhD-like protein n=1 Tax=Tumebacillus permanentifrigoris TaxID=378543 RepID=A0A316D819_9BACL|nr:YwhD family protein [Tumebacillus permanentifrigoris]PWK11287.1 YwhD-like protein [Tumebacillus permanentifrigoris]